MNPPLRGNPRQIIGAVYGLSLKESLEIERDLFFLLSFRDLQKINSLVQDALWPYMSDEADKTGERYFNAHNGLTLGELRFKVLDYKIDDALVKKIRVGETQPTETQVIRQLKFEVEVIVPGAFPLDRELHSTSASCAKMTSP